MPPPPDSSSPSSSFAGYRAKALGRAPSNPARCRAAGAGLKRATLSELHPDALWAAHGRAQARLARGSAEPPAEGQASLLELKAELAQRLLGPSCELCFLRCPVDRRAGEVGACGLGAGLRPYQDFVHLGEELELIPTHAVYLAGCNYRCAYCSDWTHVVEPTQHPEAASAALAASIDARRGEGTLSLSFVGGLPDVNLPAILSALVESRASTPLVWNTNLSGTERAHDLLEGLVDAYVADLKYGNEACAQAGSAVKGSLALTQRLLKRVAGEAYVIVRHLLLPGHLECCTLPALDWLAEHLPGARLNLMGQYLAPDQVRGTDWERALDEGDLERARARGRELGFDLEGPGRIEEAPQVEPAPAAAPAAGFSSEIRIQPDGRVVIENLSSDLSGLLDLGEAEEPRREAGREWRED